LGVLADVRFTPESDRLLRCRELTLCAISDQSALQQKTLFDTLIRCWSAVTIPHRSADR
jgi:hypothetical protein